MPSRRHFLQSAAVLTASPLSARVVFAGGHGADAHFGVVYDSRYREARSFAGRAGDFGAAARAIEGDITALWQYELRRQWQAGPALLAGLTERPALFLLEQLGWEHGLRVVYEAEHTPAERGEAAHRIIRAAATDFAPALAGAGSAWPVALADTLFSGSGVVSRDYRPSESAMAARFGEPARLYSWIIAPRVTA